MNLNKLKQNIYTNETFTIIHYKIDVNVLHCIFGMLFMQIY